MIVSPDVAVESAFVIVRKGVSGCLPPAPPLARVVLSEPTVAT